MAALVIITGDQAGRRIALDSGETVLGRSTTLPACLEGQDVSRRHARIVCEGNRYRLEDLGSRNGTFVNDRRVVSSAELSADDRIRIGGYLLRFEGPDSGGQDLTIQEQTLALASNQALYRENPARKLQAVLELAHDLANTLQMEPLLERFLDYLPKLFPKADRALVIFLEKEEPVVRVLRDMRTRDLGALPAGEARFSRSVLRQVIERGMAVLAEDTQQLDENATLQKLGVRSLLCVPLRAPGGTVFGAVQVDRFRLGDRFAADDLNLLTAAALQLSLVLEQARLHGQLVRQERMAQEIAVAREIQLAFLPRQAPSLPSGKPLDLFADLHPALEVSGDFYDFIVLDAARVAVLVADVSGKGMPAALFMSMVRAMLRQIAAPDRGPAETLSLLNDAIVADNPKGMFVTAVLGIYNAVSGEYIFARGGHPAPLLKRGDGAVEIESHRGCLLGFMEPCPPLQEQSIQLQTGEAVLLYTDGVTEAAREANDEMFGEARLLKCVEGLSHGAPLSDWAAGIRQTLQTFCHGDGPQDDVTLLLLRRTA